VNGYNEEEVKIILMKSGPIIDKSLILSYCSDIDWVAKVKMQGAYKMGGPFNHVTVNVPEDTTKMLLPRL